RDALLVPEVVGRIHRRLHRGEPLEVAGEVLLPPHLAALERAHVVRRHRVLADVQVPEVHVRLPRVAADVRLHERVQATDPPVRRRSVAGPVRDVLDVVQDAAPVRVRRRRGGDATDEPAHRLEEHLAGAVHGEPREDVLPHVRRDGSPDVVGLGLGEGAQAATGTWRAALARSPVW
ncbi:Os06g0549337, partial [Oryza sativa Japonica Group]